MPEDIRLLPIARLKKLRDEFWTKLHRSIYCCMRSKGCCCGACTTAKELTEIIELLEPTQGTLPLTKGVNVDIKA